MGEKEEAEAHISVVPSRPTKQGGIWKTITIWKMLIFHLLACIGLSLAMIFAVHGYKALDGNSRSRSSHGKFTLRSSDITSLVSAAIILLNVLVTIWCSTSLAQCAFAELERSGMTISQFNRMMTWPNIPRWKISGISGLVMVILLANFPQMYIAPVLEGSVNWGAATAEVGEVVVASGNPAADFNLWGWYQGKLQDRKAAVRRAAGMANLAWGITNGSSSNSAGQKRCRHVTNDDQVPINSRLIDVTMPCIIIHNINWPNNPGESIVEAIADRSENVTISDTTAFSFVNYPGNAVLFDQSGKTLKLPYSDGLGDDDLFRPGSVYPASFRFSGVMTAIVLLGKAYDDPPSFVDGFGYAQPNNNFSTSSSFGQLDFTHLEVNFTVGITTAPSSTYISGQVVEGAGEPQAEDIMAGPWVLESLRLLPDVMSMVAIMNTTSLDTWDNLFNYTENLIRYSYQGSWDMLQRNFDPNSTSLVVKVVEPRVQASVSHARVYGWLFVNLLLTLSVVPLVWLTTKCDRNIVIDGPLSLLLTDPTDVIKDGKTHLSNLGSLAGKEKELIMQLAHDGSGGFKLNDHVQKSQE